MYSGAESQGSVEQGWLNLPGTDVSKQRYSIEWFLSDPYHRSDLEEAFSLLLLVMIGPTSRMLSNYSLPMLHRLT